MGSDHLLLIIFQNELVQPLVVLEQLLDAFPHNLMRPYDRFEVDLEVYLHVYGIILLFYL